MKYFIKCYNNCESEPYIEDYIEDMRRNKELPFFRFPEQYDGQKQVKLSCTQHTTCSSYRQRQFTQSWINFLSKEKQPFEAVQFCTKTTQAIFDAICTQDSITSLWIKWCCVPDMSKIVNLKNLKKLYIGLGTSVTNLSPISELKNLEVLRISNTFRVTDYSFIGNLEKLKALEIRGTDTLNPVTIKMKSDEFLFNLKNLEFLVISDAWLENATYLTKENLQTKFDVVDI